MLKFAIIGCGRIGARHLELALQFGGVTGVCDIDQERLSLFQNQYNCFGASDVPDFLNNVKADVIVVCTPNGLHAQHSIAALRSGFHVLCEKPMSIHVADATSMIEESIRANRLLMIVKQNRYNPPVKAVKQLLNENKLGRINSFQLNCFWNRGADYYTNSWHGTADLDGGTLFTPFSHFIDLLFWFLGDVEDINSITANFMHPQLSGFDDAGVVLMKMKSGAIGTLNYNVNCHQKNMEGSITLFGEKGTVKIGGAYLNELSYQSIDGVLIPELEAGNPANSYGSYSGSMSNHEKVYENLTHVIRNNATPHVNMYEALKTVEIISKIYQRSN